MSLDQKIIADLAQTAIISLSAMGTVLGGIRAYCDYRKRIHKSDNITYMERTEADIRRMQEFNELLGNPHYREHLAQRQHLYELWLEKRTQFAEKHADEFNHVEGLLAFTNAAVGDQPDSKIIFGELPTLSKTN